MKHPIFRNILAGTALLFAGCASQNASLVPNSLSREGQDTFREIAREIQNPCAEEELRSYKTLETLLDAGKTCREAYLLAADMDFYIRNGVDKLHLQGMVRAQSKALAAPAQFKFENRPRLGKASAPVEIVVFSDFQCPFCARAAATIHRVYEDRPDDISVVFKQMPLTQIHPYAGAAAIISAYAQEKGRFWEVHDRLFANQKGINADSLTELLAELGSNPDEIFDSEIGQKYSEIVIEDIKEAEQFGVSGTPSFFINGVALEGGANFERLMARIDAELRAPEAASEEIRQIAREKALENCPYPGHEEIYALLMPAGRADLSIYTESVLCPCPGNPHNLHDCAAELACPAAGTVLDKLMTMIMEDIPQTEILKSLEVMIRAERFPESR